MTYMYYETNAGPKDSIEVSLDNRAHVRVMDSLNFQNYKKREKYRYHGGFAKKSPVHITPPHQGHWYVVLDLGGKAGRVKASVRVLKG